MTMNTAAFDVNDLHGYIKGPQVKHEEPLCRSNLRLGVATEDSNQIESVCAGSTSESYSQVEQQSAPSPCSEEGHLPRYVLSDRPLHTPRGILYRYIET